jgi:hypothetical protein
VDRADHHPGLGDVVVGPELRDPEVHDLRGAVVEQPHVARLDVAVHDAALVRVREPAADLRDDVELLGERQRLARAQQRLEVGAGQHLHRDEEDPAVLAELVDRDDVRVRQPRRRRASTSKRRRPSLSKLPRPRAS